MPRKYGVTNLAPWAAAPAVGPAGDVYYNTATKITYVSDGTAWNQVGASLFSQVKFSGLQPIGASATVQLTTCTIDYDQLGIVNTTTGNLTIAVAGDYELSGRAAADVNGGRMVGYIQKASTQLLNVEVLPTTSRGMAIFPPFRVPLIVGDAVNMKIFLTVAGTANDASSAYSSMLCVKRVA